MSTKNKKWRALDHYTKCKHDTVPDTTVKQEASQTVVTKQRSKELIIIKDSEDVKVQTTDTQAAVALEVAIEAAIAAVLSVSVADTDRGRAVAQDITQLVKTKQRNFQKTVIYNSKCVNVITKDTQISVSIQALLQILVAIILRLDIL